MNCPICKAEHPETLYLVENCVVGCDECATFYATTDKIKPILCVECGEEAAESATEELESGDFFQTRDGTVYCSKCVNSENSWDYKSRLGREAYEDACELELNAMREGDNW